MQLLFNYLSLSGGSVEYNALLRDLWEITIILEKKNVHCPMVFHGCLKDGNVRGETVSNELWYWVSNGFIEPEHDGAEILLKCSDKMSSDMYQRINWNLSDDVVSVLRIVMKSIIKPTEGVLIQ